MKSLIFRCAIILSIIAAIPAGAFDRFVFWVAHPDQVTTATHITPQVWVEGDTWAQGAYPRFPLGFWLERGILPLRSLLGMGAKHADAARYAESWLSVARRGYPGIAIDEFGSPDPAVNRALAEALRRVRNELPGTFIAVWHAGWLTRQLAEAYRDAADLVLLETYAKSGAMFAAQARLKLARARAFGIVGKCALALGVNDTRPDAGGAAIAARDRETVREQLDWIRRNARDTAGLGFFAIYASDGLVKDMDQAVRELFVEGGVS